MPDGDSTREQFVILHLDDDPMDQELVRTHLEEQGIIRELKQVNNAEDFRRALLDDAYDIILSDYGLPAYSGVEAFRDTRRLGIETPFLLVSGTIGEETALDVMRAGVVDYVFKHQLERLDATIRRAVTEARERASRRMAEEELRRSEALFRQMAESLAGVFWMAETDLSRIHYITQTFAKVWHRDLTSVTIDPKRWFDFIHPSDRRRIEEAHATAFRKGPFEEEYRILRPDGSIRWILDRRFPVLNQDGVIQRFTGLVEDITEKKNLHRHRTANQVIAAALSRTSDALEAAHEIIPTLLEIFGWDGAHVWMMSEKEGRFHCPADWVHPALRNAGGLRVRRGLRVPRDQGPLGSVFASRQGRWVQGAELQEHIEAVGLPIRLTTALFVPIEGKGANVGVLVLFSQEKIDEDFEFMNLIGALGRQLGQAAERDVMETALRESQIQMRSIVDNAPAVIFVKDLQGRILLMNRKGLESLGKSEGEVMHRTYFDLLPGELAEILTAKEQEVYIDGFPVSHEVEVEHPDRKRTYLRNLFPLRDVSGNICALGGITTDLSERKGLEEQIRQVQKMDAVGRLAGGIAHDFNNLLSVIIGYTELVLDDLAPGDVNREAMVQIHKAGERASSLTRQLLLFSRREKPQLVDIHFNLILSDMEKMLHRLIGEDVKLETRLGQNMPPIRVDKGQIEQVLLNLVVNARDAMPRGGSLTLVTRSIPCEEAPGALLARSPSSAYVLLEVQDTGVGIDPAVKDRIFEPFFTTKSAGHGTGLGLATVFGILEEARGWIDVVSEPGHGATFRVFLPSAAPGAADGASKTGDPSKGLKSGHILLVEDEPGVRALTTRLLERAGFSVTPVEGAARALAILEGGALNIDLILTDVIMPDMSGPRLVAEVRQRWPHLSVAYMSGYTDDRVSQHGVSESSAPLLQKPFTRQSLLQFVQDAIRTPALAKD